MNTTNTPAAPAAPAGPVHSNINAILQGYQAEAPAEEPAAEAAAEEPAVEGAEAAAETTEETTEEAEAKPKAPFSEADLFTEEALATSEGISKAREFLRKRNAKVTRRDMAAERRHEGLERKATELTQTLERARAFEADRVHAQRIIRSSATPKEKIAALGRLAGGVDGLELLEEINVELANIEKGQPKSREQAELEAKVERLEAIIERGAQGQRAQQEQRQIHQARMGLVGQAKTAAEDYPHLAQFAADQPDTLAEAIGYLKESHHATHRTVLDDAQMFGMLEEHLAQLQAGPPAAAKPNAGAGQATSAANTAAKPGSGRGARPPNGKTISPGLATQTSGARRAMSEDEVIEAAAKDVDWLASILPGAVRR